VILQRNARQACIASFGIAAVSVDANPLHFDCFDCFVVASGADRNV
jgi:hypothetical protein